jgi:hypothetical protein
MRIKKGSKRGQIRLAFEDGGEKKAYAVGKKLGLRESRVTRWIKIFKFGRPSTTKKEEQEEPEPKRQRAAVSSSQSEQRPMLEPTPLKDLKVGQWICTTYNPALRVRLIGVGEQQCVYKNANGREITIRTANVRVRSDQRDK